MRQALFSLLGDLSGTRVLDLYAGTGALGIEALSRGAAHAVFVERWRPAREVLAENLVRLGLAAESTVLPQAVERARASLVAAAPFDLVFVDPPWGDLSAACAAVVRVLAAPVLRHPALVVLEHPTRVPVAALAPLVGAPFDRRTYGDTALSLFRIDPSTASDSTPAAAGFPG